MQFPATYVEMRQNGYSPIGRRVCRKCGETLSTFRTPKGKRMDCITTPSGRFVSHYVVCAGARSRQPAERESPQLQLFIEEPF